MDNLILEKVSLIGGRSENQDSFGYTEIEGVGFLAVVCDGMGGANGGKTASRLAVETIIERVKNTSFTDTEKILTDAIQCANRQVYSMAHANADLKGMGTTAVVLLINDDKATAAHVGDSRIYQIRGQKKVFRTFDHSAVFELVKRGTLSEEQARLAATSNVILRAIGVEPEVDVEISEPIPYLAGDRFLLCSDGISGALREDELLRLLAKKTDVKSTVENLAEIVDQTGKDNGGEHDNLTAVLIELNVNSKIEPSMNKTAKRIILLLSIMLIIAVAGLAFLMVERAHKPSPTSLKTEDITPSDSTVNNTVKKQQ